MKVMPNYSYNPQYQKQQNFGMAEFTKAGRKKLVSELGEEVVSAVESFIKDTGGNQLKISYLGSKGPVSKFSGKRGKEYLAMNFSDKPLSESYVERIVGYISRTMEGAKGII